MKQSTSKSKNKRNNILNVLNNLNLVFTGVNLHNDDKPSELEENIAARTNWKRKRFDEIAINKKIDIWIAWKKFCLSESEWYV